MKSAPGVECCARSENMGWRYFVFTLGGITLLMFFARFFLFHLFESPKVGTPCSVPPPPSRQHH